MTNDSYSALLLKLDAFIRKYYINQLMKGTILSVALIVAALLLATISEYFFYFSSMVRAIIFWSLIASALFVLVRWVVFPLVHYFRLGKIISHEEAAHIVGNHFADVQDRLLNILQLKQQALSYSDASLIEASINQKASSLRPVSFTGAINLSLNRKYLRYVMPPVMVFVFMLFAAPNILRESATRLLHNQTAFEKKAPFQFVIQNKQLKAIQFEDYEINVKVEIGRAHV